MVQHDADGLEIKIISNGNVLKSYNGAKNTSAWQNFDREINFYRNFAPILRDCTPHIPNVIELSNNALVLENGGVQLSNVLKDLSQNDLHSIIFQIAYTVSCMESLDINHGDLYCNSNVLVRRCNNESYTYTHNEINYHVPWNWKVYIIDFDLATWKNEEIVNSDIFEIIESIHAFLPESIPHNILDRNITSKTVIEWVGNEFKI